MTQRKLKFAVLSRFLLGAIVVSIAFGGFETYTRTQSNGSLFVWSLASAVFACIFFNLSDFLEKYTKEMSKK